MLKPQDLLVLLKLAVRSNWEWSYAGLADTLGLGTGEAHRALRRAEAAGLYSSASRQLARQPLVQFLLYGAPRAYFATLGSIDRGIPTGLSAHVVADNTGELDAPRLGEPMVWASPDGTVRATTVSPLYPSAPIAALQDHRLHVVLALLDGLRAGRAREKNISGEILSDLISENGRWAER